MKQLLTYLIFPLLLAYLAADAYLNRKAIDALIYAQQIETTRAMQQSKEIAKLRREIDELKAESPSRLLRVERQMDLIAAASRSGWRAAERLLRTEEFREGLE